MATYSKQLLSGSNNGMQILISGTSTSDATSIHTAVAGTTNLDEIWLYASNNATASINLTTLWGGTSEPTDQSVTPLQSKTGRVLIVDGKLLQNSLVVKTYASITNFVSIDGFVNRITP